MFLPSLTFTPDEDDPKKGSVFMVKNKVPTSRGLVAALEAQTSTLSTLGTACLGACVTEKIDGSRRFFAGTKQSLFEGTSGTWVDRSRSTPYGTPTTVIAYPTWSFAQYGNVTLAAQKADPIQQINTGSVFGDLSGAPSASIIETVNDFVFAFDTNDVTYGDSPNRWRCCALGNITDWTPDIGTQAATGTLGSSAGGFTAAKRFGDAIIAYKRNSMFRGRYVGPPVIWSWSEIANDVGAGNIQCVVPVTMSGGGFAHFIINQNGFYKYDGSAPVAIANPMQRLLTSFQSGVLNPQYIATIHDPLRNLIYIFALASGVTGLCYVYNYVLDRWGDHQGGGASVRTATNYVAMTVTYIGNTFGYFQASTLPTPACFLTNGENGAQPLSFAIFDKTPTVSSVGIGRFGKDETPTLLTRIRPRYAVDYSMNNVVNEYTGNVLAPTSSYVVIKEFLRPDVDVATPFGGSPQVAYANGRYDVLQEARFHSFMVFDTGACETTGFEVTLEEVETTDEE